MFGWYNTTYFNNENYLRLLSPVFKQGLKKLDLYIFLCSIIKKHKGDKNESKKTN
jgi:thermostable 8-oxoguanine DNA glycosylase